MHGLGGIALTSLLGEQRALGQEPVSRMQAVATVLNREGDECVGIEVRTHRMRTRQRHRMRRDFRMQT